MRIDDNVNELSKHNKWNKLLPQNRHCFININHEREKKIGFYLGNKFPVLCYWWFRPDASRLLRVSAPFGCNAVLGVAKFSGFLCDFLHLQLDPTQVPQIHLLSPDWFDMERWYWALSGASCKNPLYPFYLPPVKLTLSWKETEILISERGANTRAGGAVTKCLPFVTSLRARCVF